MHASAPSCPNSSRACAPDVIFARIVLEACQEGILFLSAEGRIPLGNPHARAILGLEESHLVGRGSVDPDVFSAVDETAFLDAADQALYLAKTHGRNRLRFLNVPCPVLCSLVPS